MKVFHEIGVINGHNTLRLVMDLAVLILFVKESFSPEHISKPLHALSIVSIGV